MTTALLVEHHQHQYHHRASAHNRRHGARLTPDLTLLYVVILRPRLNPVVAVPIKPLGRAPSWRRSLEKRLYLMQMFSHLPPLRRQRFSHRVFHPGGAARLKQTIYNLVAGLRLVLWWVWAGVV